MGLREEDQEENVCRLRRGLGRQKQVQNESESSCMDEERLFVRCKKNLWELFQSLNSCLDDHQFKQKELESVGELSEVCSP